MKLKKIASLMLAGVMAVSMLAGCSGNNTDDNKGEGETSTATSYSTELRTAMTGAAKERVTAVANSKLDSALEQNVKKYFVITDYADITNIDAVQVDLDDENAVIYNNLVKSMNAEKGIVAALDDDNTKTTTAVNLYVVNATTSDEYALEQIAGMIGIVDLPKTSADTNYKYTYDISASIVTKTVTSSVVQGVETGVKYIAVAVTQNVTKVV
ncbi:hypothetical protein B5G28_08910 [Faecalibacterium sp. An77]|uniref:hypothetical protein n=1 Tax=unclassified Faecalibacterium TaxID=2646395 RepID=UPI000B3A0D69|nr:MULTISPECIES: hypothetical protein [unclassified Faecalibacterium]OUN38604.1 hypothetical protein B5G28_08910 [Faecalibacterium sp. An77]OUP23662.1 hypothetical protein B5F27_16325 [Faecalibacterium sp. An192]